MQGCSLYLGKASLMQEFCKKGPQNSEIFGQEFQRIYHLGKFALVKILEGTLLYSDCLLHTCVLLLLFILFLFIYLFYFIIILFCFFLRFLFL